MRSSLRLILAIAFMLLTDTGLTVAQQELSAEQSSDSMEVRKWIEQLGHRDFSVRRRATRALTAFGPGAIELLKEGTRSPDPETQRRCHQILDRVFAEEHRRVLEAFREDPTAPPGNRLPGWNEFRELCGDHETSRALLISIHENERELMTAWATGTAARLAESFQDRCNDVQQKYRGTGRRQADVETVASLLFVATTPTLPTSGERVLLRDESSNILNSLLYYTNVKTELTQGKYQNELRKLMAKWIAKETGATSRYQKLQLGMRYDLPEGVMPAERMIRDRVSGLQLQFALLALGELGTEKHLPLVQKSFQDATVLSQSVGRGQVQYRCEVRDVALAVAVHLTAQDPQPYGFARLRKSGVYLFHPNSAGFESADDRMAAFAEWDRWMARRSPRPDGN